MVERVFRGRRVTAILLASLSAAAIAGCSSNADSPAAAKVPLERCLDAPIGHDTGIVPVEAKIIGADVLHHALQDS